MMLPENEPTNATQIDTNGGPSINGDVNAGGDFVGRDKTTVGNVNDSMAVAIGTGATATVTITAEATYTVSGINPYLGLRAFRYEDRAIYAGREQLALETVQRLTTPGIQQTLLFITGASGSGKSSFAQAGLIPLLESHYAAYQKTVRHAIFRPSSQPMVMLADALQKLHPDLTPETLTTNTPKAQINLLLIDQFEELFIQSEAGQRAPFCDFLTNLPSFADCRTHILITLRVDYLDELFAIQPLWAIAKEGVELRTMSADDLRNAIQKPLQVHHPQKRFAPELLDRLVQDAGADAALLPLLQVTLAELWKTGKLVLSNYHSLTDAIRQRAETVYAFSDHASADPKAPRPAHDQQELLAILVDLINVSVDGTDRRDARQRRTRQELEQGSTQRPRLIEELVNARLLAAASETRNGADVQVIDIIHESLIDNWDRLRQAIEEQRQQLQRRARFKLWLGEWLRNGRQDGYLLLTDMQLAEAQALVEGRDIEVQVIAAQEFYQLSLNQHEIESQKELQRIKELAEAQLRRIQTFRWALAIASVLLVLTAALAWFARDRQIDADNKAAEARIAQANAEQQAALARSRQLAAQSTSELGKGNYELAILLAIESGIVTDSLESFAAIRLAIANPWHSVATMYATGDIHRYRGFETTWSKDEDKILTASIYDGTARIWNTATGEELVKLPGQRAIWSHNENSVLTNGKDSIARIWDAASGDELVRLAGVVEYNWLAAWSHDDRKILARSESSQIIHIWDVKTGQKQVRLAGHLGDIWQATWSHDDQKVLTISADGTARIWNSEDGQKLVTLTGSLNQAIWNSDESKILTSSDDHTARIWDATSGTELLRLQGHDSKVLNAIWNANESKILTISNDGTIRVWSTIDGEELIRIPDKAEEAKWSKDESKILTRSDDTVRIWDTLSGQELLKLKAQTGIFWEATWLQDGSKILTHTDDGVVRVWDAATGQELFKLDSYDVSLRDDSNNILISTGAPAISILDVTSGQELVTLDNANIKWTDWAAWSPDNSKILTHNNDGAVHIWDTTTGREMFSLGSEWVNWRFQDGWAQWSSDSSKILTRSDNSTIHIWDIATKQQLFSLDETNVNWAELSQDGSKILTHNDDGAVHVYEVATHQELLKLNSEWVSWKLPGSWAQLSPDSKKILAHSNDGTVRIWHVATKDRMTELKNISIDWVKWSPDSSKILGRSDDGTFRVWDVVIGQELVKLKNLRDGAWSNDSSKFLAYQSNYTASILDAATGQELFNLDKINVYQATLSQDNSKVLIVSCEEFGEVQCLKGNVYMWDRMQDRALFRLEGQIEASWSNNGRRLLTIDNHGMVHLWYVYMSDLLTTACKWTPRNFTWAEWSTYMEDNLGFYRPTCPNAPLPPDTIAGIQDEARQQILAGQELSATQRLEELNGWLQVNGQFKNYGVDVPVFVAEVSATATAEAQPAQ